MSILARKPRARVMAAFDALPEKVRRAIASADFAYDPEWVAERLKRSKRQKQLVAAIRARTEKASASIAAPAAGNRSGESISDAEGLSATPREGGRRRKTVAI